MSIRRTATSWMALSCVLSVAGCSGYVIKVKCGDRVNNYGLPADDPGRLLPITFVCLSASDCWKLAGDRDTGITPAMCDEVGPSNSITAQGWYSGKLGSRVRQVVQAKDAIVTKNVKAKDELTVTLRHPGPWGKTAGILVLANFTGAGDEKHSVDFQDHLWKPTRWTSHGDTVEVDGTTIRWAE
jgi:hypothetical protein